MKATITDRHLAAFSRYADFELKLDKTARKTARYTTTGACAESIRALRQINLIALLRETRL